MEWLVLSSNPEPAPVTWISTWKDRCWFVGEGVEWSYSSPEPFLRRDSVHSKLSESGLPNKTISGIYNDRGGRLWVSSWGDGIAWLEGYSARADSLNEEKGEELWHKLTTADGLCFDDVNGFTEDAKGRLWIATDKGISIRESGKFVADPLTEQFQNLNVKSIANDREGRIYLGVIGGLIIVHPDGSVLVINPASGLPQKTPQALFIDSRDRIWVGTWGGGAIQIDRSTFSVSTQLALPEAGMVGRICEDSTGVLWLASLSGGLWKLENDIWSRVRTPSGFEQIRVVASIPGGVGKFSNPAPSRQVELE